MKLQEIKSIFHEELDELYPRQEVASFFGLLLEHYLGLDRFILVLDPTYRLSKREEEPLFEALAKLRKEFPIQYILGKTRFMDREIEVNPNVLIPRPETEELVRWILEDRPALPQAPRILDLGTGSGCIAIALACQWQEASIGALDFYKPALELARKNAEANGANITFFQADLMEIDTLHGRWDLMVANPPYVREQEKAAMANNVKQYEPSAALFVPDEQPLIFYEKITDLAIKSLTPGGWLYFEINQYMGQEMIRLLEEKKFSKIVLKRDMFGNARMLKAQFCNQANDNSSTSKSSQQVSNGETRDQS